jgi:hypothetical protein
MLYQLSLVVLYSVETGVVFNYFAISVFIS